MVISIHALREEGDGSGAMRGGIRLYFYPRPPRGGRHEHIEMWVEARAFLSTPSARRATYTRSPSNVATIFLSTPSARRATVSASTSGAAASNFYPRPPRGGRRHALFLRVKAPEISIHALREEGDVDTSQKNTTTDISIHALREEGDP